MKVGVTKNKSRYLLTFDIDVFYLKSRCHPMDVCPCHACLPNGADWC